MDNEGKFMGEDLERESDPEFVRFEALFKEKEKEYGREPVLRYIESQTDNVRKVILEWLDGIHTPNSGIRMDILGCLNYLGPGDLPKRIKTGLPDLPKTKKPQVSAARKIRHRPGPKNPNITRLTKAQWEELEKKLKEKG
jgi:hypothetical protein